MNKYLPALLLLSCAIASCASRPSIKLKVDPVPVKELALPAAQPDPELARACADPIDLRGYQGLNAGPVERLWFSDRQSLADCRDRKAALQKFYTERDAALAGSK